MSGPGSWRLLVFGRRRAGRASTILLLTSATALLALTPSLASSNKALPEVLTATTQEPRAYGYQVGDVMTREVTVHSPVGLQLDTASLPTVGRQGHAFELRQVQWEPQAPGRYRLRLAYQVFLAPQAVRTLELPPVILHFTGQPRAQDLRIDAWPVTVAPLVPVEVSARTGLGELQPDATPPLLDTGPARRRLWAYGAAAALLAAWLVHVYWGLPWLARRQRPFEQAWRALRALPAAPGTQQPPQAAMQALHQALNRSAGVVLFEHGVDDFVAAQPRFAPMRDELLQFFRLSRSSFFGRTEDTQGAEPPMVFLTRLCRRCLDAERGAA